MESISIDYQGYLVTTEKHLLNVQHIHKWLSEESYWNKGISLETVQKFFDNSFCIGTVINGETIGFGRLVTDYAVVAYLADVFVREGHRGKGLGKMMMKVLFDIDWVKQLRAVMLATRDAHELYRPFGFTELPTPERYMKLNR